MMSWISELALNGTSLTEIDRRACLKVKQA